MEYLTESPICQASPCLQNMVVLYANNTPKLRLLFLVMPFVKKKWHVFFNSHFVFFLESSSINICQQKQQKMSKQSKTLSCLDIIHFTYMPNMELQETNIAETWMSLSSICATLRE